MEFIPARRCQCILAKEPLERLGGTGVLAIYLQHPMGFAVASTPKRAVSVRSRALEQVAQNDSHLRADAELNILLDVELNPTLQVRVQFVQKGLNGL